MIKITRLAAWMVVVVGMCSAGLAAPTYLASSFETLYRVNQDASIESWDFPGVAMRGMHYDASTNTTFLLGDTGGAFGDAAIYIVQNAETGTPALTYYSDLAGRYGSLTGTGSYFYGFDNGMLYRIDITDPMNPIEEFVGNTGISNTAGAAYDPATDTLFMISYDTESLYQVDQADASVTLVGGLGINSYDYGAYWFSGGLYAAAQNADTDQLEIGTINASTGAYTTLFPVADGAYGVATALAIIPEPTCFLLLLAGVLCIKR